MLSLSLSDLIRKSIARTKKILFEPFSWKRWIKLIFIAFLAGAVSISGGSNWGSKGRLAKQQKTAEMLSLSASAYAQGVCPLARKGGMNNLYKMGVVAWQKGIILWLLFGGTIFFIVWTWLSCRFKFIWYDAIVKNTDVIKEPFRRYKKEGNSLFGFFIVFSLLALAFSALIFGYPIFLLYTEGFFKIMPIPFFAMFHALWPLIASFVVFLIVTSVVVLWIENFVVPIMAIDDAGFTQSWRSFLEIYKRNKKDLWKFCLIIIGLGIIIGLILSFLGILLMIGLLIIGGIGVGLLYAFFVLILKMALFFKIIIGLLGVLALILLILLFTLLQLPFAVFYRTFSLYYLSALACPYTPLSLEEEDAFSSE